MMLKLKFTQNLAVLYITNSNLEQVIFNLKEMIGILNITSIGHYRIKQGIIQQSLSKYYRFESADTLCEQFNRFINTLKKERKKERKEETQEKYLGLDPSDERKYMSDRKIFDKYVDLDTSCLTDAERKQVMDMLYKYKTFSCRNEIGTCPNIDVEINIIEKIPIFD